MRKSSAATKTRNIAMLLAAFAVLVGCESTNKWFKKYTDSDKDSIILGAPGANEYLTEIYELADGDPATQAEIFANAKESASLAPGTSTRLRYALVLATPGHAENNDVEAERLLRELLAQPELMTPAEIALATIHSREVAERLRLSAEAQRLRSENPSTTSTASTTSTTATTEDAALAQRVARVEAENRRLRQSLTDAEAKLEALSAIERSLREESANDEPP